eukprot:g32684.t1
MGHEALKRAQEAPSMGKKDELVEKAQRQREEAEAAARKERMEALRRKQEEQKKAEEEKKKRMEEMEDGFAWFRMTSEASMEAAKKQQAERAAAKAAKEAETLYADMPQPDADTAAATEAALKAAGERGPQIDLALPPEERGKVVFLDVDGYSKAKPDTSDFFPAALKALRYIMERSSPRIVLCSEWRRSETLLKALEEIFYKNRLRLWSDVTSIDFKLEKGSDALRCFAERRAKEISEWLRQHEGEISGWAVLDDINLSMTDEAKRAGKPMGPHHVQTWPLCGLTTGNVTATDCFGAGDLRMGGAPRVALRSEPNPFHWEEIENEPKVQRNCIDRSFRSTEYEILHTGGFVRLCTDRGRVYWLAQNEHDHRLPDWKIHFSVELSDIPRAWDTLTELFLKEASAVKRHSCNSGEKRPQKRRPATLG